MSRWAVGSRSLQQLLEPEVSAFAAPAEDLERFGLRVDREEDPLPHLSRSGLALAVAKASELEAAPVEEERSEERTLWDELNAPNIPKWGTSEARMREMLRLQRRVDELRRRKKEE